MVVNMMRLTYIWVHIKLHHLGVDGLRLHIAGTRGVPTKRL